MTYMQSYDVRVESDIKEQPFAPDDIRSALETHLWRLPTGVTVTLVSQSIVTGKKLPRKERK